MCETHKSWLQSTALALIILALIPLPLAVGARSLSPVRGPLIVLSAPWSDPSGAIRTAGGSLVGPQRAFFGVLAASEDPDFEPRLAAMGFWSFRSTVVARLICGVDV